MLRISTVRIRHCWYWR